MKNYIPDFHRRLLEMTKEIHADEVQVELTPDRPAWGVATFSGRHWFACLEWNSARQFEAAFRKLKKEREEEENL